MITSIKVLWKLTLFLCFCIPHFADATELVCNITNIRTGGQPGDAYVGPTCNGDGTYRTCFYVTGSELPADPSGYQIKVGGITYPIAFNVAISSSEVVLCATNIPGDGTPNVSVSIQLISGCSYLASNLFTEPDCSCDITNVRVGGQPGDAYVGPTCNGDGTYRTCFYITGQFLPAENSDYQISIDGVQYPVAFTVHLSQSEVVVCVTGIPGAVASSEDVTIQLESGCSYSVNNLYTSPICVCTITSIRLGGQPGDAFIGPTCNGDGTYRVCFYISGFFLPLQNPDYQFIIDGVEYPVAFTVQLSPSEVVVCVTGIPADGTQNVPVYVRLASACDYQDCTLFNEPVSCPGGTYPPDPLAGPWNAQNIGNANGNVLFDACEPDDFIITASGYPLAANDTKNLVFQNLCGNGEIVVHISSINNPGWAGIVMQENLSQGSKKVALKTQLGNFVLRDVRLTQNGFAQSQQLFRPQASWLKLVRSGSNFQGYSSINGQSWQFAFSANLSMSNCINLGMFAESFNNTAVTIAVFDYVNVIKSGPMPLVLPEPESVTLPDFSKERSLDFGLYPNPTREVVQLDLSSFVGQQIRIDLYSIAGVLIRTWEVDQLEFTKKELMLNDLQSGTYLVKVSAEEGSLTKKVVLLGAN